MVRYPVNLKTFGLISQINSSKNILDLAKVNYGISIKNEEIKSINALMKNLKLSSRYYDSFYIGYTIPQISKEFDLIRIEENRVINIELKSIATEDRIKKQLIQNAYYLSFLNKNMEIFSFIEETNTLYKLENFKIKRIEFPELKKILTENLSQVLSLDINKLFNPSNYLVSPFNSTEKFLEDNYFLTDHQNYIKNQILRDYYKNKFNYYNIEGGSGTGKSLMVYDIAKTLMLKNKKVGIIHVGKLNEGHKKLIEKNWYIRKITELEKVFSDDIDILIFDESQRLEREQVDRIFDYTRTNRKTCIFSLDPRQTMGRNNTTEEDMSEYILSNIKKITENYISSVLTTNIRSNMEIEEFIKVLFSIRKYKKEYIEFNNIIVNYFKEIEDMIDYSMYLNETKNCELINYTIYAEKDPLSKLNVQTEKSAHSIIGQEFENVFLNLDNNFIYDYTGKLKYKVEGKQPYYDPIQMAYQIGTRAKNKLYINILNNPKLYYRCMKILNKFN
ncbi:DNA/RNA helicase domain-containing protein [Miniphocaeibacter massiliensis]|uniref:DNA/RNA helicase domain-containing protein n=1 Tax=Miniphocaeibacter massiliensis TaxID=2041841 RepID=UPI000C1BBB0E|nr:DNA/RNA helicase domain-containing protein [Miniphocaeibacter massiliensis]